MALIRFPHSGQEERFEFSPENRAELERVIARYPVKRSALIPALQLAQKQAGFITSAAMQHVAEIFEVSPMEVWGVVSFYTMLKTQPIGEYHVQVCNNLSCALMGAGRLLREIENRLDCRTGHTREDGKFSIEAVECLGACGGAPCVQINEDYFERVTPEIMNDIFGALEKGESVSPIGADEVVTPALAGAEETDGESRGA